MKNFLDLYKKEKRKPEKYQRKSQKAQILCIP